MDLLTVKSLWVKKLSNGVQRTHNSNRNSLCGIFVSPNDLKKREHFKRCKIRALANQKSVKRLRRQRKEDESLTPHLSTSSSNEYDEVDIKKELSTGKELVTVSIPTRSSVLQACTITSVLIAGVGVLIRQVSHVASTEGFPILDCSREISFNFEMWHIELIAGLVLLISSCRYLLLSTWADFAESSEAANQQILASLEPLDYIFVAFLPGISEEVLFRGALLPLFGINWKSAMFVGVLFGVLHLGSGRKYSFAIWATFVGFVYGYGTIISSSLLVPMASHAANNLVGGLLWRYSSKIPK